MGTIRVLYATVERRSPVLQIGKGDLDADGLVPHSFLVKRRVRRASRSRSRDQWERKKMGDDPDTVHENGGDEECRKKFKPSCSSFPPTESSPDFGDTSAEGSASTDGSTGSSSAEVCSTDSGTEGSPATTARTESQEPTSAPQGSVAMPEPAGSLSSCCLTSDDSDSSLTSAADSASSTDSNLSEATSSPSMISLPSDIDPFPTTTPDASITSSTPAAAVSRSNKTGAIVGGVLGGLLFLLLSILGAILFLRRRRHKRTPPSAEFRDRYIPRSAAPPPLTAQISTDDFEDPDGRPPPFEQGDFNDPLFEKIHETQRAHVRYGLAS